MPPKQTNPQLDAPTLSDRVQPIEWPHEQLSPEIRTDAISSATTFEQVFQHKFYNEFSAQADYVGDTGAMTAVSTIEASFEDKDEASAQFQDVTQWLEWCPDGGAPAAGAPVAFSSGSTVSGTWVDTSGRLARAKWIKHVVTASVVTNNDGTSTLNKVSGVS